MRASLLLIALAACSTPEAVLVHLDSGPSDAGILDAGLPDAGIDGGEDGGQACGAVPAFGDAIALPQGASWDLQTADFNHDGLDDPVQFRDLQPAQIYYGLADGGLEPGPSPGEPHGAGRLAVADMNADGWPDLVIANTFSDPCSGCRASSLDVEMNQRDGSFAGYKLVIGGLPTALAIADFDGDGRPDVAICSDLGIRIFFDDGGVVPNSGGAPGFAPAVSVSSDTCFDLVAARFSAGSPASLVSLSGNVGDRVSVRFGLGDGGFLPPIDSPLGGGYAEVVRAADLNGDGILDLVVGGYDRGIAVLLNVDGTSFAPAVITAVPPGIVVQRVAIADLNGDGYPDILSGGSSVDCTGPALSVFLNDCGGGFPSVTAVDAGLQGSFAVTAMSSAAHGRPDIVVGDICFGNLTVFPSSSLKGSSLAP